MEKNKTIIIIAVAAFIFGLIISYAMWGTNGEEETDIKQLLSKAMQGIEVLEKENRDLRSDLKRSKKDNLKKENQTLKEQLQMVQQENEKMQNKISKLKAQVAHTALQLEAKEKLSKVIDTQNFRLAELEKENQDLRITLEKIVSFTKQQEIKTTEKTQKEIIPEQPQLQEEMIKEEPQPEPVKEKVEEKADH